MGCFSTQAACFSTQAVSQINALARAYPQHIQPLYRSPPPEFKHRALTFHPTHIPCHLAQANPILYLQYISSLSSPSFNFPSISSSPPQTSHLTQKHLPHALPFPSFHSSFPPPSHRNSRSKCQACFLGCDITAISHTLFCVVEDVVRGREEASWRL